MPQFILNNRDAKFPISFWKHLFQKVGMKSSFNMTFHPQIDGQIENVNGVLNQYLKNYVNTNKKDWGEHLGLVEFYYKFTTQLAMKMFWFELTLGKEAKKLRSQKVDGLGHSHGTKKSLQKSCEDGLGAQRKICPSQETLGTSLKEI